VTHYNFKATLFVTVDFAAVFTESASWTAMILKLEFPVPITLSCIHSYNHTFTIIASGIFVRRSRKMLCMRSDVLRAVTLNSCIFWSGRCLPTFRRNVPLRLEGRRVNLVATKKESSTQKDGSSTFPRNVESHVLDDTAHCPRKH
jgi:hypothetical protein